MPKKKTPPKMPPPGREPTPEYLRSVWATDYIPDWIRPAPKESVVSAQVRLGVVIPKALKDQLAVQNGGQIFLADEPPFEDVCRHWTNAIVDGLMPVEEWEIATDNHLFQNASDVPHLESLVVIAAHSESQLCLDYRACGPKRLPAVTYIDVCIKPTKVASVCSTVTEFLAALISSKRVGD